ncbi:helix-turn-helix domain-containing protein [Streptomyces sp. NPDC085466]|uniref:helix-turn-helix domain-containing protein n=1 Tax=Streptomyces sp. NPDC085466 TaxID=3365725 RepID=UPI0037CEAF1E
MASRQPNAPSCASGLVHRNVRLTTRYVVVSNDLAQHAGLSLAAIGLAVHLQSLPAGSRVGIKALAARYPESELRVTAAMRELEAHGFLERVRHRLPNGRISAQTISYNRPRGEAGAAHRTPPAAAVPMRPAPTSPGPRSPGPAPQDPGRGPEPDPRPDPGACQDPGPAPAPNPRPAAPAPRRSGPPLGEAHRRAVELLAGLRAQEPRMLLAERDVQRLAPGVAVWLGRGADPAAVCRTLCADLPPNLLNPAGLLAHRLKALLPPPLPAAPVRAAPVVRLLCEDCERPFPPSVTTPGRCLDCRAEAETPALDPHAA